MHVIECTVALQVCHRSCELLYHHMTRFTYSPTGALKWKKDVNEYAEVSKLLSAILQAHSCKG